MSKNSIQLPSHEPDITQYARDQSQMEGNRFRLKTLMLPTRACHPHVTIVCETSRRLKIVYKNLVHRDFSSRVHAITRISHYEGEGWIPRKIKGWCLVAIKTTLFDMPFIFCFRDDESGEALLSTCREMWHGSETLTWNDDYPKLSLHRQ